MRFRAWAIRSTCEAWWKEQASDSHLCGSGPRTLNVWHRPTTTWSEETLLSPRPATPSPYCPCPGSAADMQVRMATPSYRTEG